MIVCNVKSAKDAQKVIEILEDEMPWARFLWKKNTGDIEETLHTGEKLYKKFGCEIIWRPRTINVRIGTKEYPICSKFKQISSPKYDGYNREIGIMFWSHYALGLITGDPFMYGKKKN